MSDVSDLGQLQERLGHRFGDISLLRLALTHPSTTRDPAHSTGHNQRLEFLGDAVLELVLTSELYHRFPTIDEGLLTKARAHLVNRRFLAERGSRLGLGPYLYVSRGEEITGGRARPSSLADAFEAVAGAIYLDAGFEAARTFVLVQFGPALEQVTLPTAVDNPKGELQELVQTRSTAAPSYRLESASGPDHDRLFECAVVHEGRELGRGTGRSKKEAESAAARVALDRLRAGAESSAPGRTED